MLESETTAKIPGAGTPGPDGSVELPLDNEGKVTVTFQTPPRELTQVQITPPTETQPGDVVKVTVQYTDEEGKTVEKVI